MLASAGLPVIHAGSGIIHAGAYAELAEIAEMLQAPVTTSWAARGVLDERNPLSMAMIHIKAVNQVRNEADVVLCLGSRIGEPTGGGRRPTGRPLMSRSSYRWMWMKRRSAAPARWTWVWSGMSRSSCGG